jgi:hypothetical protein
VGVAVDKKGMLRLRLMQRLGLLGPLVRTHRRIEQWEDAADAAADRRATPATLRTLGRTD